MRDAAGPPSASLLQAFAVQDIAAEKTGDGGFTYEFFHDMLHFS
jgi:hypothetical protein